MHRRTPVSVLFSAAPSSFWSTRLSALGLIPFGRAPDKSIGRSAATRTRREIGTPPGFVMPTFIDESGDTGPNPDPGNHCFRLAAVWVPSHDVAEAFRESVRRVRRALGLRARVPPSAPSLVSISPRRSLMARQRGPMGDFVVFVGMACERVGHSIFDATTS